MDHPAQPVPNRSNFQPLLEVWRGPIVESVHSGALAVVTPDGQLTHSLGNPYLLTYMRSSGKPFQLLPFVEAGGVERFGLTEKELAILCASHDGTDEHVAVLRGIQEKVGVTETQLQCGAHPPYHGPTEKALWVRGEAPTPNRHNCSGKHTAMLALAKMLGAPLETYLDLAHPVQQAILAALSDMVGVPAAQIVMGIDGCTAPVHAVPVYNAALGFARLADPGDLPEPRRSACRRIVCAMMDYPEMIGGPGTFDTALMQAGGGRLFTKAGAEGFQATGIMSGLPERAPARGVALKIADGDISGNFRVSGETAEGRARPVVMLEALRQLGAISEEQLHILQPYAGRAQFNWRGVNVGRYVPVFQL